MNGFDLNIANYTPGELLGIFQLPVQFDIPMLQMKADQLSKTIQNNRNLDRATQEKTLQFIVQAKNILIDQRRPLRPGSGSSSNLHSPVNQVSEKIMEVYNTGFDLKPVKLESRTEHMVQERPDKPYLSSFPSEFFPGIINPLKKRTIRRNLNVDTRFRDNYFTTSASNFLVTVPFNLNDVLSMQLSSIELPMSFFNVSKQYGNNFFWIGVNGEYKMVTIPDGNYTQDSIAQVLNKEVSLLGGVFATITFVVNIDAAKTTGTNQMMVGTDLSGNNASPAIFELNFQMDKMGLSERNVPLPMKFGWLLGFRNGAYINNTNYVSEGIVDLSGPKYVFLAVDDFNNSVNSNGFYSAFNGSILNKNILARISIAPTQPYTTFSQSNLNIVTTPREYFGPVNIQNMQIQLLDEYGRVVNTNHMDYSFCLNFYTSYDI
jgi:hypothetical protein